MTNTFRSYTANNVGTTPATMKTMPAAQTGVLVSSTISNKNANQVAGSLYVVRGGVEYYILYQVPIPAGATLTLDVSKIVIMANDTLNVKSDTANSIDIVSSMMEIS